MNRHPLLGTVAKALSSHVAKARDIESALLCTGTCAFSGERRSPPFAMVMARGSANNVEGSLNPLAEELLRALLLETTFLPGVQKAALVAYRSRMEVHVRLARSWVDASGMQPTHDILVEVRGRRHRARIGSLAASLQEVRQDGSLLHVQGMTSGESPARKARVHAPNQSMPNVPVCMHIPDYLGLAHPTQADLLAWSEAHYGKLELEADAPAPYQEFAFSKYE